jgi:hypothetical protein
MVSITPAVGRWKTVRRNRVGDRLTDVIQERTAMRTVGKMIMANCLGAVALAIAAIPSEAGPLPASVAALKSVSPDQVVQARWGGGWGHGGWGHGGWGHGGWGHGGWGWGGRGWGWGAGAFVGGLALGTALGGWGYGYPYSYGYDTYDYGYYPAYASYYGGPYAYGGWRPFWRRAYWNGSWGGTWGGGWGIRPWRRW